MIVLATSNTGKAQEFLNLGKKYGLELRTMQECPVWREDAETFDGNARIKAGLAFDFLKHSYPVMADDSGLCIPALGGFPGIFSARWFGKKKFSDALPLLLDIMKGVQDRSAFFVCALAVCYEDGITRVYRREVWGTVTHEVRSGEQGMGYDPIFLPMGHSLTFAEDGDYKDRFSHRSLAFADFYQDRSRFLCL